MKMKSQHVHEQVKKMNQNKTLLIAECERNSINLAKKSFFWR